MEKTRRQMNRLAHATRHAIVKLARAIMNEGPKEQADGLRVWSVVFRMNGSGAVDCYSVEQVEGEPDLSTMCVVSWGALMTGVKGCEGVRAGRVTPASELETAYLKDTVARLRREAEASERGYQSLSIDEDGTIELVLKTGYRDSFSGDAAACMDARQARSLAAALTLAADELEKTTNP